MAAIFFSDLKKEAQKRIISEEMLQCKHPCNNVSNIRVDKPEKKERYQYFYADIDGSDWLYEWDSQDHEIVTLQEQGQTVLVGEIDFSDCYN